MGCPEPMAAATGQERAGEPAAARVTGVTKRYPGVLALDQVGFTIRPGEVRALLGKNGAGKSTLIRMLTGAEMPDAGEIEVGGVPLAGMPEQRTREATARGVRAVYQELSLVPGMSVAENLALGAWPRTGPMIRQGRMMDHAAAALGALGCSIAPGRLVAGLSSAERQLVEISRAMAGGPRLVILDEPTSSLAAAEVDMVFEAVRRAASAGIAVIYVSHRMREIRAIAHSVTVMRDGRRIDTLPIADAATAAIVRMMLGHDEHRDLPVETARGDEPVLRVERIAAPPRLAEVSFELKRGEILGIAGLLGAGRTELLRIIAGLDRPQAGSVKLMGSDVTRLDYRARVRRGMALTSENRKEEGIFPDLGVDENITLAEPSQVTRAGVLSWARVRARAGAMIQRMDVRTRATATPIGTLSGGNQQKVVIGRWVYAGSRVLLLDEPTRGVDVEAKTQIYGIMRDLAATGCSVVFVSSEIEELPAVCDRVLVLDEGRITRAFTAPRIDADQLVAACLH